MRQNIFLHSCLTVHDAESNCMELVVWSHRFHSGADLLKLSTFFSWLKLSVVFPSASWALGPILFYLFCNDISSVDEVSVTTPWLFLSDPYVY